jgi:hypothetical protein
MNTLALTIFWPHLAYHKHFKSRGMQVPLLAALSFNAASAIGLWKARRSELRPRESK